MAGEDLKGLTGQQKAGIMMLAIVEDRAAKLFGMMDEEELKELSQAMANLGTVNSKTIEALFVEFASLVAGTGSLVGTYASTERLLAKSLSADKVNEIMEDIRGPADEPCGTSLAMSARGFSRPISRTNIHKLLPS